MSAIVAPAPGQSIGSWTSQVTERINGAAPSAAIQIGAAITVTAGSWSDLPSPGPLVNSWTNPSATLAAKVRIYTKGLLVTSSSDLRVGVASDAGSSVSFTAGPGGGAMTSWSQAMWNTTGSTPNIQASITDEIEVPAGGTLNWKVQAYRPAGSSATLNYPCTWCTFERWA
jgi:hypothetical protein